MTARSGILVEIESLTCTFTQVLFKELSPHCAGLFYFYSGSSLPYIVEIRVDEMYIFQ